MFPGSFWKRRGTRFFDHCAPHQHFIHGDEFGNHGHGFGWGGWEGGIRRPLRFLAYKLGLDDAQFDEVARIIEELKTEAAQATVDHRRALSALADALSAENLDPTKVQEVAAARTRTSERINSTVAQGLTRLHALLRPEQRKQLGHLLRAGFLKWF